MTELAPVDRVETGVWVQTDEQLVADCQAGRSEAFEVLVRRHQDRLYGSLCHALGSSEDALDACQEAFMHAFRAIQTFRGEAQFYSWLYRIALNAATTIQRSRARRPAVSLDQFRADAGAEPAQGGADARPEGRLEREETITAVQLALAALEPEQRLVIVLRDYEGLSYDDIAATLNCPIGTLRSRLHRARVELMKLMKRSGAAGRADAPVTPVRSDLD